MKLKGKFISAVVFLLSGAMTLQAAWTTRRLTYNAGDSGDSDIAVWGENVYAAWRDDTPGKYDIYFRKSTDGGAAWQIAQNLSNTWGDSYNPDIAVSGPNVYLVWVETTSENFETYFRKSTDGGATWQTARNLSNNAGNSWEPSIAVSGLNIYVVWEDSLPGNEDIYFRKSTDGGATWQTAKKLTNDAGRSLTSTIAVDNLNVFVIWQDNTPGDTEIYFRKSTDGGATWQTAKRLTNNIWDSSRPRIAVSGSNVYAVWQAAPTGYPEIYFRKSTDGGATWPSARKLTNNTGTSESSAIAVKDANVFVAWQDNTPGDTEIYFRKSTDGGAAWQTTQRLTNNTGGSNWPGLAANGSNVYVIWQDDTPGNNEIYVKYSPL